MAEEESNAQAGRVSQDETQKAPPRSAHFDVVVWAPGEVIEGRYEVMKALGHGGT